MKKVLLLAAAMLAAVAAPALAQDRDGHRDHDRGNYHHDGERREHRRDGDRREYRHDGERREYRRDGYRDGDRRFYGRPGYIGPRYPAYAYPRGYGYRRWAPGGFLPGPLFGAQFWFNDFGRFGFAPPPYGLRWVRYGPDLLLVNVRNGRVRDVRYGVFG